jgi:4-hydroxy-tetrahydrodipicolinate reductase
VATRIVVPGAAGKMGRMVVEAIGERSEAQLSAAIERPGHASLGEKLAQISITSDLPAALAAADAYVDFTVPAASVALAQAAAEQARGGGTRTAAVIGTTGLDAAQKAALEQAAKHVPVLLAANFSLGVNLLLGLAEQAARSLGPDWDLEIVELHHKLKRDAPSGTALAIGEALARGLGTSLDPHMTTGRSGEVGARPAGEIGVLAVRGADVVGEHTAYLFGAGERLELTHRATSRMIFARGAVRAALWLAGKPAGLYDMRDVLGLR